MRLSVPFVAATLCLVTVPATAHDYQLGDIEIGHPWTRETPPSARVGSGYLSLTNEGETADRLVGGESPIAGRVEIHTMTVNDEGVMQMRPLPDGVEIPAGESVELAPGGYHLMLMDLAEPIVEGEMIPLTLEFEHAGTIEVELAAEAIGGSGHDHGDHGDASDEGHAH